MPAPSIITEQIKISGASGLSDSDVLTNRALYGSNMLHEVKHNRLAIVKNVLLEPMMLLLIVACSIYFFSGQISEGITMLAAIFIVAGISIFQEIRSENAINELHKLTQPLTLVIRNGEKISIHTEELVVGDRMIVSEGQQVAADAEILDSNDCTVNEAILTGESLPVSKGTEDHFLFAGTSIVSGLAHAQVTSVGSLTRIGRLGKSMEEIKKEKTPLQQQVTRFVRQMAIVGMIAFIFVWIFNYYDSGDVIHSLMHGLTLAMAVLPEEIPVALSTFMALGAYRMVRNHVLTKHPQTVEALGSATVICVDKTGTITENKMVLTMVYDPVARKSTVLGEAKKSASSRELLDFAMLASEAMPFDPMEVAIRDAFEREENSFRLEEYRLIHEYPLSGNHPMMTHVYQGPDGTRIIACKGAPEGIISASSLHDSERKQIIQEVKNLAEKGYRVLAVGKTNYPESRLPDSQAGFLWEFLGLIALNDPPKKNIAEVMRKFYQAGISVKMITGDFPQTACSIAHQAGLQNVEVFLTGKEVIDMDEVTLRKSVTAVNVFARMMPEAKLRVINALKSNGEVVAMTGDGVNDGPALKSAHIGIAMGKRGSGIARQAASLVLLDDDLGNMVTAVALGRKIYSNLKKAIQYIISIHIPLLLIVTLPLVLGWLFPNIFSPIHIIFLELVMGPTCSIVYENEPMEQDAMDRPPRKFSSKFFTWRELSMSILQGLVIASGLMLMLYFGIHKGYDESRCRTLVFATLVISNILLTLTGRSRQKALHVTLGYRNRLLPLMIFLTSLLLALSIYSTPVRELFQLTKINTGEMLICLCTAGITVLWIEVYKILKPVSKQIRVTKSTSNT